MGVLNMMSVAQYCVTAAVDETEKIRTGAGMEGDWSFDWLLCPFFYN